MSDFKQRINRFVELDAKATPGPWEYDTHESSHTGEICGYMTKPDIEDMLSGKDCDIALSCAYRNYGLSLLQEMQVEIDRLRNGITEAIDNVKYYFGDGGDAAVVLVQLESLK